MIKFAEMTETSGLDVTKMSLDELKEECRKLNLRITGNKAALQQRVRTAMEQRDRSEERATDDSEDN